MILLLCSIGPFKLIDVIKMDFVFFRIVIEVLQSAWTLLARFGNSTGISRWSLGYELDYGTARLWK